MIDIPIIKNGESLCINNIPYESILMVSRKWGFPKWMVFVRENPIWKWMMTMTGIPISGNLHIMRMYYRRKLKKHIVRYQNPGMSSKMWCVWGIF